MDSFLKWELKTNQYQATPIPTEGSSPSEKKFTRITTPKGSWILMQWNIQNKDGLEQFLDRQKTFLKAQITVPEIKAVDQKKGLILLEDLGSLTLNHYTKQNGTHTIKYYKQAINHMISLQKHPVHWPRFKKSLLFKEMLYTKEYLTCQLLHFSWKKTFLNKCFNEWYEICNLLDSYPHRPTHRDFHSQNLLIKNQKIYVIDFQSAGLLPRCYDLSSLIYDPYTQLSSSLRKQILQDLIQKQPCSQMAIQTELLTTGVQRIFKASGSFASFYFLRGQTSHLPYILPALKTLKTLLEQINLYPCFLKLTSQLLSQIKDKEILTK